MDLRSIAVECGDIFGTFIYIDKCLSDHFRVIYSSDVLLDLKIDRDNYIEYSVVYLGSGQFFTEKLKTTSKKIIIKKILNKVINEVE